LSESGRQSHPLFRAIEISAKISHAAITVSASRFAIHSSLNRIAASSWFRQSPGDSNTFYYTRSSLRFGADDTPDRDGQNCLASFAHHFNGQIEAGRFTGSDCVTQQLPGTVEGGLPNCVKRWVMLGFFFVW